MPYPRPHHYQFAHVVLRELCEEDTLRFFATMASPERCRLLAGVWAETERRIGRPVDGFDPAPTSVTTCRIGAHATVIVSMPAPVAVGEAHFVGVVLAELTPGADPGAAVGYRYFTLELGDRGDGSARTVLCEWKGARHLNFGDGPAPEVDAFVAALAARL